MGMHTEEYRKEMAGSFLRQEAGAKPVSMREFAAMNGLKYYTLRDWVRDEKYRRKYHKGETQ